MGYGFSWSFPGVRRAPAPTTDRGPEAPFRDQEPRGSKLAKPHCFRVSGTEQGQTLATAHGSCPRFARTRPSGTEGLRLLSAALGSVWTPAFDSARLRHWVLLGTHQFVPASSLHRSAHCRFQKGHPLMDPRPSRAFARGLFVLILQLWFPKAPLQGKRRAEMSLCSYPLRKQNLTGYC